VTYGLSQKLTTETLGCNLKWTWQHYYSVGLDEPSSGVTQDISQIGRQPASTGRSSSRISPEKNLHTAIDNEAVVGAWDLASVKIKIKN
jgi:hypothetical protein